MDKEKRGEERNMNITFLIGNGFDRNLGLATTYAEFVDEYKKIEPATEIIRNFRNHIRKNEKLWSAAEIALGQYTAQLQSGQGAAFSECHTDICEELAKYLKGQQDRINYGLVSEKAKSALRNLNGLAQSFPTQERAVLNDFFKKYNHEGRIFNFINFNYTDTLGKLTEIAQKEPELLGTHKNGSQFMKHIIGQICPVHGTVDGEMVFGVNDDSQIANNAVFECDDGDIYKNLLIKQQANAAYLENTDAKAAKILNDSHIICVYGMSIGATDKLWWNRLCKWLSNNSDRHLIIQKHSLPEKGVLPAKYQLAERNAKRDITRFCDFDEAKKHNIEERIHITNYNVFEPIQNIAMSEEEKAKAYLTVLAQITAEENAKKEPLPSL